MVGSRFAKRLVWGGAISVAVLVATLGAGYGFLQTDAGRHAAARVVERALSTPGETEVSISGLHGTLPHKARAEFITVGDGDGIWAELRNVALDWRPLSLISGAVRADRLGAESVRVRRLPDGGEAGDRDGSPAPVFGARVDRIAIDEVALDKPVLGTPATFSVTGHLAAEKERQVFSSLTVQRTDGVEGRLHAEARYDGAERRLEVDVGVEEPEGGLLARALDLPDLPAVSVRLSGAGPLTGWRGDLRIGLHGLADAKAEVAVSGNGPYAIAVRGKADVTGALDHPLKRLARGTVSFDTSASWAPAAKSLAFSRLDVASESVSVAARGHIALDSLEIDATASVRPLDRRLLHGIADPVEVELTRASVTVRGPLGHPSLEMLAVLEDVHASPLASGRGEVRLSAEPRRGGTAPLWSVDVRADLAELGFEHAAAAGILGETVSATLSGDVDPAEGALADASFELVAERAVIRGNGRANLLSATGEAEIAIALADLSPLGPVVSMPLRGSLDLRSRVSVGDTGLVTRISGRFGNLDSGEPVITSLFGASPALDGSVGVEPSGHVTISDASLEGPGAWIQLDSTVVEGDEIDGTYRAVVKELSVAARATGAHAAGTLRTQGRISGPIDDPTVEGTMEASALRWEETKLGSAKGHYSVRTLASAPRGKVSLDANTPAGTFVASMDVSMSRADVVRIRNLSIKGDGIAFAGRADVPVEKGVVQGRLQGSVARLERWTALVGTTVAGSGRIDLRLQERAGRQAADIRFDGKRVAPVADVEIARLSADISATGPATDPRARVQIEAHDVRLAAGALKRVSLTGEGDFESFRADIAANGDVSGPLDIEARVSAEYRKDMMRVTLSSLSGSVLGAEVAMRQAGTYAAEGKRLSISLPRVSWGDAAIAVSGNTDGRSIAGRAVVQRLSAATLSALIPGLSGEGRLAAELELSGKATDPSGELHVALEGLKFDAGDTANLPPLSGSVTGVLRAGRLDINGDLAGVGKAALRVQADVPLTLVFSPFAFDIPQRREMSARLSWKGDIAPVSAMLPLPAHRLSGALDLSVQAGGTPSSPVVDGAMIWSDGRYENIVTGTVLADIDMRARMEGNEIVLRELTATDGAEGRLSGNGAVRLTGKGNAPITANLTLRKFAVLRRDDVSATASGELAANGALESLDVAGRIQTERIEAYLADSLPPGIVELDVVEINGHPSENAPVVQESETSLAPSIALDITVTVPHRAYLRGRGLDSEWAGELRVTGSTESPVLNGELRPVRGRFNLAGTVFRLKDGGRVVFDGSEEIDPRLDISAEHQADALTAVVRIQGTASQPRISLTSTPEFPRDEILSHVLFNKGIGTLSPGEAAQLASAAATLTGITGGGAGILDRIRDRLGVDTLRIGEGEEGDATVGVGKYLSDDVYVGVDAGPAQRSGNVSVEITVIPNVTVETDVGADARSRVGVNWSWDY